jgi:23S rRNA pseudouridine2605 synthase
MEGGNTWLAIVLHEGKNRQIRRLAEHAGYRVMRLTRNRFAGLTAAGLDPGAWRRLTAAELRSLQNALTTLAGSRKQLQGLASGPDE